MSTVLIPIPYTISNMVCATESSPEFVQADIYNTGNSVQVAAENSVYKSLKDSNTGGSTPSVNIANALLGTETATWIKDGATNPSRLTDEFLHSQTIGDETINNGSVSFDIETDSIDMLALMNIEADSVDITYLADDGTTVIKEKTTTSLLINEDLDIMDYIYNEDDELKNAFIVYLPRAYSVIIRVALHREIGVAKVGIPQVGRILQVGVSKWGIENRVKNYGGREDNTFGISTFNPGEKVNVMKVDCIIPTPEYSAIFRKLKNLIDTPTLVLGDSRESGQEATWVYASIDDVLHIMSNETTSKVLLKANPLI